MATLIQKSPVKNVFGSLVVSTLCFAVSTVHAGTQAPDVFVKNVADALVAKLKAQRSAYKKDPKILTTIVQQNIEPYVDFDGFARGVMGKHYRVATDAQKVQFTKTFHDALVRTYATSLGAYDNESYTIRPFKADPKAKRAIVVMDFKTDNGTQIPVAYQIHDINGSWKVRNVQLNGIDLGLTFQNQFNSAVQKNKGNLDLAIKNFVPDAEKK